VRHFPLSPSVDIRPDERGSYHALTVVAGDRPGLLYALALVLTRHGIDLHSAKINTLGDRAEDVFIVSGDALERQKTVLQMEQELLAALQVPGASGVPMSLSRPRAPAPETALR
jgi:[protein-PII] uridylyltransferase